MYWKKIDYNQIPLNFKKDVKLINHSNKENIKNEPNNDIKIKKKENINKINYSFEYFQNKLIFILNLLIRNDYKDKNRLEERLEKILSHYKDIENDTKEFIIKLFLNILNNKNRKKSIANLKLILHSNYWNKIVKYLLIEKVNKKQVKLIKKNNSLENNNKKEKKIIKKDLLKKFYKKTIEDIKQKKNFNLENNNEKLNKLEKYKNYKNLINKNYLKLNTKKSNNDDNIFKSKNKKNSCENKKINYLKEKVILNEEQKKGNISIIFLNEYKKKKLNKSLNIKKGEKIINNNKKINFNHNINKKYKNYLKENKMKSKNEKIIKKNKINSNLKKLELKRKKIINNNKKEKFIYEDNYIFKVQDK